jgi:hypothetical protein
LLQGPKKKKRKKGARQKKKKKRGYRECSSGYASTDTSQKKMLRTAQLRLSLKRRLNLRTTAPV